tara:strand:+ start:303 stop:1064 length:762 start_codon:yes stop_codon:yes gene_type:complete
MIQAAATLISGGHGFFLGAIGQKKLLDKHCPSLKHVVMVERNSYSEECLEYLKTIGSDVRIVKAIRMKKTCKYNSSRWPRTFTKLNLWSLTDFEHVLFMDADAYPYSSELLNLFSPYQPPFLAATAFATNKHRFRSGMMVVRPDEEMYNDLCKFAAGNPWKIDAKLGDQGILNRFVTDRQVPWTRMPYNWHTVVWHRRPKKVIIGHLRPKPWGMETRTLTGKKSGMYPYVDIWRQAIIDTEAEHGQIPRGNLT